MKDSVFAQAEEEIESFAVTEGGVHGDGSLALWPVMKRARGVGDGWKRQRREKVYERCLKILPIEASIISSPLKTGAADEVNVGGSRTLLFSLFLAGRLVSRA